MLRRQFEILNLSARWFTEIPCSDFSKNVNQKMMSVGKNFGSDNVSRVRYENQPPDEKTRFCFDGFLIFNHVMVWSIYHIVVHIPEVFLCPKNFLDQTDGK